jgi:tryptophan-rich sensory protein
MDMVIFFIPLLSGFLSSMICKIKSDSGSIVKAIPPSYMFGIIWFILYILMGFSWLYSRKKNNENNITDLLFSLLIISLFLWIFFYSCRNDKKAALYIIPLSMMITIFILINTPNFYIVPLLIWLLFAFLLNFEEVNLI